MQLHMPCRAERRQIYIYIYLLPDFHFTSEKESEKNKNKKSFFPRISNFLFQSFFPPKYCLYSSFDCTVPLTIQFLLLNSSSHSIVLPSSHYTVPPTDHYISLLYNTVSPTVQFLLPYSSSHCTIQPFHYTVPPTEQLDLSRVRVSKSTRRLHIKGEGDLFLVSSLHPPGVASSGIL